MKKKDVSKEGEDERVKKEVSEDQVNFESGTSDQAMGKAFHIVVNLRISTAHSHNVDFNVTDDEVKNALVKVYRNDKEQKNCPVTYDNKFLLTMLHQYGKKINKK